MAPNPIGLVVTLVPALFGAVMLYPRLYLREQKHHLLPFVGGVYLGAALVAQFRIGGPVWATAAYFLHAFTAVWVVQLVINWLHLRETSHPIARRLARWRFY